MTAIFHQFQYFIDLLKLLALQSPSIDVLYVTSSRFFISLLWKLIEELLSVVKRSRFCDPYKFHLLIYYTKQGQIRNHSPTSLEGAH